MNRKVAFKASSKFYGNSSFPYGISRSGEFSRQQAQLLESHGVAYEALYQGKRAPVNREEERFLAVCRGESEPLSEHEKVWMLFLSKAENRSRESLFRDINPNRSELGEDDFEEVD